MLLGKGKGMDAHDFPIGKEGLEAILAQRREAISITLQSNLALDQKLLAVNGAGLLFLATVVDLALADTSGSGWSVVGLLAVSLFTVMLLAETMLAWRPMPFAVLGTSPRWAPKSARYAAEVDAFLAKYCKLDHVQDLQVKLLADMFRTFTNLVEANEEKSRALGTAIVLLILQVLAVTGTVLSMR